MVAVMMMKEMTMLVRIWMQQCAACRHCPHRERYRKFDRL